VETGKARVEGPEFETIALCGSSIANGDPELLVELNALCDDLGLDTISTGGAIAFMMEMSERGIRDFGLRFGETRKAIKRITDIAHGRGIGRDAVLGSRAMNEQYGGEEYAMQIKGMGLACAIAPRGGCHMTTYPIAEETWGALDPFTFDGKAKLVVDGQNAQFAKFSRKKHFRKVRPNKSKWEKTSSKEFLTSFTTCEDGTAKDGHTLLSRIGGASFKIVFSPERICTPVN